MTTINPTYKIDTSQLDIKINRINKRAENLPWAKAGVILKQSMRKNFDTGGRYLNRNSKIGGSKKWVKRKKNVPWPLLKKSLALKNSMYWQLLPNGVKSGSRGLPYNRSQNLGNPRTSLAARPFVVAQKQDIANISAIFKNYVGKGS